MIFTLFGKTQYQGIELANIFVNLNHYYNIMKTEFQLREHKISGDQRPEQLAYELYKDPNMYWVFFLVNEITDPYHDWVKGMTATQETIDYQYQHIGGGEQVDHYVDESGRQWFDILESPAGSKNWYSTNADGVIDRKIYFGEMIPVSITENEHDINEAKRVISIVQPKDARRFVERLKSLVETYNADI